MNFDEAIKDSLSICSTDDQIKHYDKLVGKYKLIKSINNVRIGTYIRWIRVDDNTLLTIGGVIVTIKINASGEFIDLYNKFTKLNMRLKFDECIIIYQKISEIELLINSIQKNIYENDIKEF